MTLNADLHLKKDDCLEASVIEDDEGKLFITLQRHNLTIYFEGDGFENYKNACRILDRMKSAVHEAWRENKGGSNGNKRCIEA